jgi:hypothetical protein
VTCDRRNAFDGYHTQLTCCRSYAVVTYLQKSKGHNAAPSKQRSADTSRVPLQALRVAGAPVCSPKQQCRLSLSIVKSSTQGCACASAALQFDGLPGPGASRFMRTRFEMMRVVFLERQQTNVSQVQVPDQDRLMSAPVWLLCLKYLSRTLRGAA